MQKVSQAPRDDLGRVTVRAHPQEALNCLVQCPALFLAVGAVLRSKRFLCLSLSCAGCSVHARRLGSRRGSCKGSVTFQVKWAAGNLIPHLKCCACGQQAASIPWLCQVIEKVKEKPG